MKYNKEEFPCNACGQVLFSQSGLSNHQRSMHRRQDLNQPPQSFECNRCNRAFEKKQSLASHKGNSSCGNSHKRGRQLAPNFIDLNQPPVASSSQPNYEKLHDDLFPDAKERSCRPRLLSDQNASLEAVQLQSSPAAITSVPHVSQMSLPLASSEYWHTDKPTNSNMWIANSSSDDNNRFHEFL